MLKWSYNRSMYSKVRAWTGQIHRQTDRRDRTHYHSRCRSAKLLYIFKLSSRRPYSFQSQ